MLPRSEFNDGVVNRPAFTLETGPQSTGFFYANVLLGTPAVRNLHFAAVGIRHEVAHHPFVVAERGQSVVHGK